MKVKRETVWQGTHCIIHVRSIIGAVVDIYGEEDGIVLLAAEMEGLHGAIIGIKGAEKKISGETGGFLDQALDKRPLNGGR